MNRFRSPDPRTVALLGAITCLPFASADVTPHPLFTDHAVLQQGGSTHLWGWADPGESVTVTFREEKAKTMADSEGNWSVNLATGAPGGPFSLTFQGNNNTVTREDVFVGEVWLASGQSNMEWKLGRSNKSGPLTNAYAEIAAANLPTIRQFDVPNRIAMAPESTVEADWTVCSPDSAGSFSAVAFFFAKALQEHLDVPIGIIDSTWGGTPAQSWTSADVLREHFSRYDADLALLEQDSANPNDVESAYRDSLRDWYAKNDPGSGAEPWSATQLEMREWTAIPGPTDFVPLNLADFDGTVWFRAEFSIPAEWTQRSLILDLGPIDDADATWLNGALIGETQGHQKERRYVVPAGLLREGRNVLAVRVLDTGSNGGFRRASAEVLWREADQHESPLPLKGDWKMRVGRALKEASTAVPRDPRSSASTPSGLYNAMIAPLVGVTAQGVIWYQGESNAGDPAHYRKLFPAMIEGWRTDWDRPDWPFLFVQIAPFQGQPPEIREAQLLSWQETPHTAMVVTLDIGDADDIHPPNKQPVGERLARAARALVYGENIPYSGPIYRSMEIHGERITLHFDHASPGLIAPTNTDGLVDGFEIAGSDGEFHPATAEIDGETVVVYSEKVENPSEVRYAWANIAQGNLFNRAGLPASPFRTNPPSKE